MDWTNEMCIEFLKVYETKSLIWNPKDKEHKNRNAVNDAWLNIQQELSFSCTLQELKKKKESLMATFRPLLNKVKSSMKTGSGEDDVYKPNWFAFDTMAKFLVNVYRPRSTISTQKFEDVPINDEHCHSEIEDIDINSTEKGSNNGHEENSDILNSSQVFNCLGKTSNGSRKRKKINDVELIETRMDEAYSIMKKACEPNQENEIDECSLYANLLAVKLRALDEKTRDILMHDIDNLYFCAKYMDQTTSNNINPQHQFKNKSTNSNIFTTLNVPMPSLTQLLSQLYPKNPFYIPLLNSHVTQPSPIHNYYSQHFPANLHVFQHSSENPHASQPSPTDATDANASTSCK